MKKRVPTARILHDPSKRTHQSNRPVNVYVEKITDDETGEVDHYLWWNTEQGDYVGRKSLDKLDELTQIKTEEGLEYTTLLTDKSLNEVMSKSFGKTKYYYKDGEPTSTIEDMKSWTVHSLPKLLKERES